MVQPCDQLPQGGALGSAFVQHLQAGSQLSDHTKPRIG
jgi:hypothetical protein